MELNAHFKDFILKSISLLNLASKLKGLFYIFSKQRKEIVLQLVLPLIRGHTQELELMQDDPDE